MKWKKNQDLTFIAIAHGIRVCKNSIENLIVEIPQKWLFQATDLESIMTFDSMCSYVCVCFTFISPTMSSFVNHLSDTMCNIKFIDMNVMCVENHQAFQHWFLLGNQYREKKIIYSIDFFSCSLTLSLCGFS